MRGFWILMVTAVLLEITLVVESAPQTPVAAAAAETEDNLDGSGSGSGSDSDSDAGSGSGGVSPLEVVFDESGSESLKDENEANDNSTPPPTDTPLEAAADSVQTNVEDGSSGSQPCADDNCITADSSESIAEKDNSATADESTSTPSSMDMS